MTRRPTTDEYRAAAKELYHHDGELEFDPDNEVRISEDHGAYVQCWRWVYDSEVNLSRKETPHV